MTRDEAERKLLTAESRHLQFDHVSVAYLVDALEVLGVLKLDAPKDPVADLVVELRARVGAISISDVERSLKAAGLKIIEA